MKTFLKRASVVLRAGPLLITVTIISVFELFTKSLYLYGLKTGFFIFKWNFKRTFRAIKSQWS